MRLTTDSAVRLGIVLTALPPFLPHRSVLGAQQVVPSQSAPRPVQGVDLGIGDDETYKRPNSWSLRPTSQNDGIILTDADGAASRPGVSIAWRNARQVEEVEVRVRNLGTDAGEGRVFVDVFDESGARLLHLEPPDELKVIRVPAAEQGGREGKILRMKASRELNNVIDQFDRADLRYDVQATVETIGPDANPFDNTKTKSWNIPFRVRPSLLNVYNYRFKNHSDTAVSVVWRFEHTPNPQGWNIEGLPQDQATSFVLSPGQEIRGSLMMKAPAAIAHGAFSESRLSLVETGTGKVYQQREWFQVFDTIPPTVSNYRLVITNDHRVAIQALVADRESGVLEATGVTTQYSSDSGLTWSTRPHNYKTGNFVRPTLFEAILGPFAPNTRLQLRFTARDTGGNWTGVIPADAAGFVAAPASQPQKTMMAREVFPRSQSNPIFELDTRTAKRIALTRIDAPAQDILKMTTLEVVVP